MQLQKFLVCRFDDIHRLTAQHFVYGQNRCQHRHHKQVFAEGGRCVRRAIRAERTTGNRAAACGKPAMAVSDENGESHGDTFLQNIARLMDEYGVSSLDELMEAMNDDRPKPRRAKDFEM